ncbi:hypothetical protein LguiA_001077 [Lonicera macranthoides]
MPNILMNPSTCSPRFLLLAWKPSYSNDIGAWKAENNGTYFPVEDPHRGNQVVGYKRSFFYDSPSPRFNSNIYYNEEDSNVVIGWRMTEYTSLHYPNRPSLEYVLCKINKVRYHVVEHDWEEFGKIEFWDEEDWEEPEPLQLPRTILWRLSLWDRSLILCTFYNEEVWEKPEKIKFYEDRQELLAGAAAA